MAEPKVFVDIPYVDPAMPATTAGEVKTYASQFFNTLEDLQIGVGATAFKVDKSGMWLGGNLFSEAPFRVDMLGNVTANSILINGLGGDIIAGAIDGDGNFVNEIISTSLNTQSKEILAEFEFGISGAIAMATDVNNGVWISPTGILGKKSGAVTFAIESDGDATFGGTLVAASGTFGTITSGTISGVTITGSTIKANNGSGADIWIENSGLISFRYGSNQKASMFSDTSGNLKIDADNHLFLTYNDGGGSDGFTINNDGTAVLACDDSNDVVVARDFYAGRDIYCGASGTFKSSDGSSGGNYSSYGFMTSIRHDSGDVQAKFREITVKDGLVTNISSESAWITMDSI